MSWMDLLKMAVKYVIVWMDRCFRWIFDILSGPVAGEFLIVLMVFCVFVGVMTLKLFWLLRSFFSFLIIFLFCGWVGKLLCLAKCVASRLMCCLGVNGVCVVGLVGVS